MRIRPDGAELLQAARVVIDAAIRPHLAYDCSDALRAIEAAMSLAADRLTQELEASAADLATLENARVAMRGKVLEALPVERRYEARLAAKALAVATRQLEQGQLPERREYERLAALLGAPTVLHAGPRETRCTLAALNERLATRIRRGEADAGTALYAATLTHLEALTHEALSESNPAYRRRGSSSVPVSDRGTSCATFPAPPVAGALAACLRLCGVAGAALYAPGNAALATQANLFGWFTQRLAANPHVPMVAVEGAHQAHDLSVAFADTSAAFFKLALAPFRRVEPHSAKATRLL